MPNLEDIHAFPPKLSNIYYFCHCSTGTNVLGVEDQVTVIRGGSSAWQRTSPLVGQLCTQTI